MADIFVSYTSSDRDWAFWIGQELLKLGHTAHLHDWEISGGGNIMAWMEERHNRADSVLCVVSSRYLEQPYSALERHGAQWAAASKRPNFLLPVFIESCEAPTLIAPLKRCDLHGSDEDAARERLAAFMKPAGKPTGPIPFPGEPKSEAVARTSSVAFPGGPRALSNIPMSVPRFFLGRDEVLAKIKVALACNSGRVAVTAMYGLRGVGKTTLAAAYAENNRSRYRATWWIRAGTESTMRADLVGLGVRLGWIAVDEKEEPALATIMERLRNEGEGILLVFDNALDADSIESYFPGGGDAHVIITSNAHAWRDIASPMKIDTWPNEIGADYLISRTAREAERQEAIDLSDALGGLPLALEQAAAYCERLEVPLATYQKRYEAAPANILDDKRDAPRSYHNRLTAAKTFALAIEEAAKLHPAAEPLIVYAALLAPEPIPLFLFSEGREKFAEPLASALANDGLDEAVAALRAFALIDREALVDERDSSNLTDCIRLHRLVRQVAVMRRKHEALECALCELIEVVAAAYPKDAYNNPATWHRARRLDTLALALVAGPSMLPNGSEKSGASLLNLLADYRQGPLADYAKGQRLVQRALMILEQKLGPNHPDTALSLSNLGAFLHLQGNIAEARSYYERALAINESILGPDHPDTALTLSNLGVLLDSEGDRAAAQLYHERALAIREKVLGPDHPDTALSLSCLGSLLDGLGDLSRAKLSYERALAIRERVLGQDHPDTAKSLSLLGGFLQAQGDLGNARTYIERALAIREKILGTDHPDTASSLNRLGALLRAEGNRVGARPFYERAIEIRERVLGPSHPETAYTLCDFGTLLREEGDLPGARTYLSRALAIEETLLGSNYPDTIVSLNNLGAVLHDLAQFTEALSLFERALSGREQTLGPKHPDTLNSAKWVVLALTALGRTEEAGVLHQKYALTD